MKRLLILSLIVFGLGVFAAQTASSAGDPQGPACSNITNGDGGYSATGVIDFTVFLQAPVCSFVTYSFFVTDTDGNPITPLTATQDLECTAETTGGGCVHYVYDLGSEGPSTVCVYATTSIHGHIADSAPNASDPSCPELSPSVSLVKGGAGATGGFN
jgi:hypothetical protein